MEINYIGKKTFNLDIKKLIGLAATILETEDSIVDGPSILEEIEEFMDFYLQKLGFDDMVSLTNDCIDNILERIQDELVKQGYEC